MDVCAPSSRTSRRRRRRPLRGQARRRRHASRSRPTASPTATTCVACALLWRRDEEAQWRRAADGAAGQRPLARASSCLDALGRWQYTVQAWVDPLPVVAPRLRAPHRRRRPAPGRASGAALIAQAAERAQPAPTRERACHDWAQRLERAARRASPTWRRCKQLGLDDELGRSGAALSRPALCAPASAREFPLIVERERARFSTWYEFFPRSASRRPGAPRHLRRLRGAGCPTCSAVGFDVLYFPPIHPIGRAQPQGQEQHADRASRRRRQPVGHRRRRRRARGDPRRLGTLADFQRLVQRARRPRHRDRAGHRVPVRARPPVREGASASGSARRPDGSVQYAENPPKKYQDIYPFDFESDALARAVAGAGRRDRVLGRRRACASSASTTRTPRRSRSGNGRSRGSSAQHPDVIFLSEAFTRPKVMHRLAKLGFSQSYTYFTWRNTKHELTEYFTELAHGPGRDYFRPNAWPNTPDILPAALQYGGRAAFMARLALAATLAASYGIYGPAYELLEHAALRRRRRGVPRLREVRASRCGTSRAPTRWPTSSPCSTASAATTRRCRATTACASCRSTTTS